MLRWRVHATCSSWNVLVEHLAVHVGVHPLVLRRLHGGDRAHVTMVEVSALLGLHLVVHAVLGRAQVLLHVGRRVRIVAVGHIHEACAGHALVRLRRQTMGPEIQALVHDRRLVELPGPSGVHSVHVLLAVVESTGLVLALRQHLGRLHESGAEACIILSGRLSRWCGVLLVLLQEHHQLLQLGHRVGAVWAAGPWKALSATVWIYKMRKSILNKNTRSAEATKNLETIDDLNEF